MVDRNDQVGSNAPRFGTLSRASQSGVNSRFIPALNSFPPPDFLTNTQKNVWIAALSDVPVDHFRARHLPMMIQYCRAVERMMMYSNQFEADHEDDIAFARWVKLMRVVRQIETQLSLGTSTLIMLSVKARSELRLQTQTRTANDGSADARQVRAGLTYVGH